MATVGIFSRNLGNALLRDSVKVDLCTPKFQQKVLGSEVTTKEREYFLALRDSVVGCDVMVDKLIIKDVQGSLHFSTFISDI